MRILNLGGSHLGHLFDIQDRLVHFEFKVCSDPKHFIFEINVVKSRIRHTMTQ